MTVRSAVLAAALLAPGLLAPPGALAQLSPAETRIAQWIETHGDASVALLERIVNQNSGTMHHEGVAAVGGTLGAELEALGFTTRWVDMRAVDRAGHLFAERPGRPGSPHVLLIGHLDTVFEPDHPFQRFEARGGRATGPGVVDMKGGDVVIVAALQALAAAGALDGITVTVALIGDEESAGLPVALARHDLIEAGKRADVALGFEPGDPRSAVVTRRGSSAWLVRVRGRQGHSSGVFGASLGSGAIFEIARILHRFHDEVRGPSTLTFNPGALLAGTDVVYDAEEKRGTAAGKTNVVAQSAVTEGDLRFLSEEEKDEARRKMRGIVSAGLPGTTAEIEFEDKYPAMPPTEGNRRLLSQYSEVSRDLGLGSVSGNDPTSRGAADISFVAPHVDGIDGLGPWGGGAHSPSEWIDLSSLVKATKRAAILLHRLAAAAPSVKAPAPEAEDPAAAPPAPEGVTLEIAPGETLAFEVAPPDTIASDLVSQVLHHALADHPTCPGQAGLAPAGSRACFLLLYGWRGEAPAPGVRLSVGIPEDVTLVGASRPPTERTSAGARWDLGTLEPGTYGTILVQADLSPGLEDGAIVRVDSFVEGDVAEDPRENNGSWTVVRIGAP